MTKKRLCNEVKEKNYDGNFAEYVAMWCITVVIKLDIWCCVKYVWFFLHVYSMENPTVIEGCIIIGVNSNSRNSKEEERRKPSIIEIILCF